MSTAKRDYYEVLGVQRNATADDLRRAYRKEALKHHPDRNQGNPEAEARFKEANEAYQILNDEQKRQVYDQFGHAGLEGGGGGPSYDGGISDMFAHMQDLFSEMFSGGVGSGGTGSRARRGGDLRVQVRLSLSEAAFGCKRDVTAHAPARCPDCHGSRSRNGAAPDVCSPCRGTGQVSSARGFVMFTSTCSRCHGEGVVIREPCPTCGGQGAVERARKVVVAFPAGVDSGQRLRVPGQGLPGQGGPAGDLYVEVDVEEDPRFERDGADLVTRAHISFVQAALGAEVAVNSLDADNGVAIAIPPGTQPGAMFTLKGHGIPRLDGRGRGSLIVVVQVDVPTAIPERARQLLVELEQVLGAPASGASAASTASAASAASAASNAGHGGARPRAAAGK